MTAVTKGRVEIVFKMDADTKKLTASIKASDEDLKKLGHTADSLGQRMERAMGGGNKSVIDLGKGIGASLSKLGLMAQGVRTVASALGELGEAAMEGAKAADRLDILRTQVQDLDGLMGRVKESTAGMLPEAEITKAVAQFRQFQIPIEDIDGVLREVARTSIRTGEDMGHMVDSLVAGIARESALRLDNLGIVLSADKVKKDYAKTLGKEVDALTQAERKTALLSKGLEQMRTANEGVNLEMSRTASLERVSTFFEDIWSGIKTGLADAAVGVLEFFGVLPEQISPAEAALREANAALEASASATRNATAGTTEWAAEVENAASRLRELNFELGRMATSQEAARLNAETIRLRQKEAAEVERLAEAINTARVEYLHFKRLRELGADVSQQELWAEEELVEAISDHAAAKERLLHVGEAAKDTIKEEAKAREEQLRVEAEITAEQKAQLSDVEDQLAKVRGVSEEQAKRQEILKGIASIDRSTIDGRTELIDLTVELLEVEKKISDEKERQKQQSMLARLGAGLAGGAARGVTAGVGRGGRGRRTERADIEDIVRLERARMRVAGELSFAQREELIRLEHRAEISEIEEDLAKRKISWTKASLEQASAELELRRELADLAREQAEEEERAAAQAFDDLEKWGEEVDRQAEKRLETRRALGLDRETEFDARRRAIGEAAGRGDITEAERGGLERGVDIQETGAAAIEQYEAISQAAMMAANSQDEATAAFGRLAVAIGDNGDEIISVVEQMATAMDKGGDAWIGAVDSAIGVAGNLAASVVKDEKTKAGIFAAMEAAHAIAAFAAQDYAGGAMHSIAAILYGVVAGTSSSSAGATAGGGAATRSRRAFAPALEEGRGTTIMNFYAPVVGGSGQEVATQLDSMQRANRGTGFESEAA